MDRELNVLVVSPNDKHGKLANSLRETYGKDFPFSTVDFTPSLHLAVKSIEETEFHLCLISSNFGTAELTGFFADIKRIDEKDGCAYLQVHPEIFDITDLEAPKEVGFQSIISEVGTHSDKENLNAALEQWYAGEDTHEVKMDVASAINVLLRKIDDAASNLKRGIQTKIDAVPTEFITLKTVEDEGILSSYFKILRRKTQAAEPENADCLDIPEGIMQKSLPKLEKNKYTGVSTRVWRRLLKKHGVEESEATQDPPIEASNVEGEEATNEEPEDDTLSN